MATVHKVLGAKRVAEICDNNHLNDDERKIIDEILEKWENLVGKIEEKTSVAIEILKNNPNSNPFKISKAFAGINLEFAEKSAGFRK